MRVALFDGSGDVSAFTGELACGAIFLHKNGACVGEVVKSP
jgi:hypothetical protein